MVLGSGKPEPAELLSGAYPARKDPGHTDASSACHCSIRTGILFHLLNQCEKVQELPRALPPSLSLPKPAYIAPTLLLDGTHTHTQVPTRPSCRPQHIFQLSRLPADTVLAANPKQRTEQRLALRTPWVQAHRQPSCQHPNPQHSGSSC